MNKYYRILDKILATGKTQTNKKGNIQYLLNEQLSLTPADLLDIFEGIISPARSSAASCSYLCRVSATWRSTGRPASTGGTIAAPSW